MMLFRLVFGLLLFAAGSLLAASRALHVVQPALSHQVALLERELGTPLFADDHSVFDAQDPIGKRNGARVVGDGEHRAALVLRDLGQQLHDRKPVLAVERSRRLVREDHGRRCHDGACHRQVFFRYTA